MRIFTAVTFDALTRQYLMKSAESISGVYRGAKPVRPENLHMTLVFIGEADRGTVNRVIRAAGETAKQIKRFTAIADGISSFRRKNRHTVYCNIKDSDQLLELHNKMVERLKKEGMETEDVKFKPHITLARQAELTGKSNEIEIPGHVIEINQICVMESSRINGILTYTPLAAFSLEENK